MKEPFLTQRLGLTLPLGFYLAGGLLAAFGILLLIGAREWVGWIFPLCLLVGGIILISLRDGVMIHPSPKRIKVYTKAMGIPVGKWKSYEAYPNLIVRCSNRVHTYNHPDSGTRGFAIKEEVYELFLASANHIHLILVKEMRGEQSKAYQAAFTLAQQLGVELMRYNPGRRKTPLLITEAHIAAM